MKKLKGRTRLIMYAGVSKPNPKLGQALGPLGMNMMQFCKEFNEKTNHIRVDIPMRVLLKAFDDRTYEYTIKPPNTSWYLKRLGEAPIGSFAPKLRIFNSISTKYLLELAKLKKEFDADMKDQPLKGIVKQIMVQAEGMGFYIDNKSEVPEIITPVKF